MSSTGNSSKMDQNNPAEIDSAAEITRKLLKTDVELKNIIKSIVEKTVQAHLLGQNFFEDDFPQGFDPDIAESLTLSPTAKQLLQRISAVDLKCCNTTYPDIVALVHHTKSREHVFIQYGEILANINP